MLRNLWAIARITALDLWTRRVGSAFLGIGVIFFGLSGSMSFSMSHSSGMGGVGGMGGAGDVGTHSVSAFSAFGLGTLGLHLGKLLALYAAAKSVDWEVQQRTLSAVMIRPVARHVYLLGRLGGVGLCYGLFLLLAGLLSTGVAIAHGQPQDPQMAFALGSSLISTLTWMAILLPLTAVTSFPLCMGAALGCEVFGWFVGMVPEQASAVVPVLKKLVYYGSPIDLPAEASLDAAIAGAASLGYGGAFFCVCALVFARQDLRLRA